MIPTRRDVMSLTAAWLVTGGGGDLLELQPDRVAAAAIGRAYLREHAFAPSDLQELQQQIRAMLESAGDLASPAMRFRRRVQQDFATGDVMTVEGWMLSRIEAQACAVAFLSSGAA